MFENVTFQKKPDTTVEPKVNEPSKPDDPTFVANVDETPSKDHSIGDSGKEKDQGQREESSDDSTSKGDFSDSSKDPVRPSTSLSEGSSSTTAHISSSTPDVHEIPTPEVGDKGRLPVKTKTRIRLSSNMCRRYYRDLLKSLAEDAFLFRIYNEKKGGRQEKRRIKRNSVNPKRF